MTDLFGPASAPNAVTSRLAEYRTFGTLDTWFKPCSNPASQDGTQVQAAWLNGVMAALRGLARGNGNLGAGGLVVPENNADGLLLAAVRALIQRGRENYAEDSSSTPNTIVANLPFVPPETLNGMRIWIKMATAPTGATAATINGVTQAVVRRAGRACVGGEWVAGDVIEFVQTNAGWQIEGLVPPDLTVGTGPSSPAPLSILPFRGFAVLTPGTTQWTIPAGVYNCWARGWGGAGGSGGVSNTGAASGGAGSGGFFEGPYHFSPTELTNGYVSCSVGSGGIAGGGGSNGGNGGATTFGTWGAFGGSGSVGISSGISYANASGGQGVNAPIIFSGSSGSSAFKDYNGQAFGGQGGPAPGAGGVAPYGSNSQGSYPGGGAAGVASASGALAGQPGGGGRILLYW